MAEKYFQLDKNLPGVTAQELSWLGGLNDYIQPQLDATNARMLTTRMGARKSTAGTLTKGTPCYFVGWDAVNMVMLVEASDASDPATMPARMIVDEEMTDSTTGHASVIGELEDINTSGFVAGDVLYVVAGGGLTKTPPAAPSKQQKVAFVLFAHAASGRIAFAPLLSGHSHSLDEIENLDLMVVTTAGQNTPYFEVNQVTWTSVANLPYDGANAVLDKITAVVSRNGTSGTAELRIYDVTNSQVIATITWTDDTIHLEETTTINNLPSSNAVFEIQMRKSTGGGVKTARCHSVRFRQNST